MPKTPVYTSIHRAHDEGAVMHSMNAARQCKHGQSWVRVEWTRAFKCARPCHQHQVLLMLFETQGVCNGSIITGAGEWWRALPALPIPDDLAPDLPTVCTAGMPLSRSPLPLIILVCQAVWVCAQAVARSSDVCCNSCISAGPSQESLCARAP